MSRDTCILITVVTIYTAVLILEVILFYECVAPISIFGNENGDTPYDKRAFRQIRSFAILCVIHALFAAAIKTSPREKSVTSGQNTSTV